MTGQAPTSTFSPEFLREALATASEERQALAIEQTGRLMELLQQNTELTRLTQDLSRRIEVLTAEIHGRIVERTT